MDKKKWRYQTVSVPKELHEAIKDLIEELKYWPSVASFAREAVLEKLRRERQTLKEVKEAKAEKRKAEAESC